MNLLGCGSYEKMKMNPLGCNTLKIEAEAKALALYASSWRGKSDVTLSFSSWRGEDRAARSSSSQSCTIVVLSKLHDRRRLKVARSLSSRRAEVAA